MPSSAPAGSARRVLPRCRMVWDLRGLVQEIDDLAAIVADHRREARAARGRQPGRRAAEAESRARGRGGASASIAACTASCTFRAPVGPLRRSSSAARSAPDRCRVRRKPSGSGRRGWGPRSRSPARIAVGELAQVGRHAPDGVEDDQAPATRVGHAGVVGGELEAVRGARKLDGLAHAGQALSKSSRVRWRARSAPRRCSARAMVVEAVPAPA